MIEDIRHPEICQLVVTSYGRNRLATYGVTRSRGVEDILADVLDLANHTCGGAVYEFEDAWREQLERGLATEEEILLDLH